MNKSKLSLLTTYLVAIAAVLVLFFVVKGNLGAPARSLNGTEDPQKTVTEFFDALHKGDLKAADSLLGHCNIVNSGMGQQSVVTQKLFDALSQSISFRFEGACREDGLNAVQTVSVTYFDINSSAVQLNTLVKELLDKKLYELDNASELYDESGEYRQDVVMELFEQAAVIMLDNAQDYYITRTFDVDMFYEGSSWYIEPSDDIISCMTGGMN